MSYNKDKFTQAKRNFNSVYYFPFNVEPGASYVLTSDPWNYLKAFIKNEHDKIKKRNNNLGPKKDRLRKALYFLSLAESFEQSAKNTIMPTKGALSYYSILNLTKVFLLVRGHNLETNIEYHGLSLNPTDSEHLTIAKKTTGDNINVFDSFATEVGCTLLYGQKISLQEMVSNLPEIHEMAFNLDFLSTTKRKFLPVKIDFISNESKWNKLTYRICFEKKHNEKYQTSKFKSGILNSKLQKSDEIDGLDVYVSKQIKKLTHNSDSSWCKNYKALCDELEEIHVRTMLTRAGYKYYLDLQPDSYNSLIYTYALMFYIGSVARYRPTLNEEILEGKYKALISELMSSTPKQFLYTMTGLITKNVCAVPMSNLD